MNTDYTKEFILKSIQNNERYANNKQYICTIQSKFYNSKDFKYQFEYLEPIFIKKKKIVGIGNLCRIMNPNIFTDRIFNYLQEKASECYWIHFYGLSLKLIKHYLPQLDKITQISVDSTKWTKACNSTIKSKFGLNCNTKNRPLFFFEYIKTIEKYINIEY
jgi:hypothetical protein